MDKFPMILYCHHPVGDFVHEGNTFKTRVVNSEKGIDDALKDHFYPTTPEAVERSAFAPDALAPIGLDGRKMSPGTTQGDAPMSRAKLEALAHEHGVEFDATTISDDELAVQVKKHMLDSTGRPAAQSSARFVGRPATLGSPPGVPDDAPMSRAELESLAGEYKVRFNATMTDDELAVQVKKALDAAARR